MTDGRYKGVAGPPEQPKTVELPNTGILEGLIRVMQASMQEGFASITDRQDRIETKVSVLHDDVSVLHDDARVMHDRVGTLESRIGRASGAVRESGEVDAKVSAALAFETQKRKALEAELLVTRQRLDTVVIDVAETRTLAGETKALTVAQTEELKTQTATLNRLAAIAANPMVKDFARMIATAIATALAVKGFT